MKIHYFSAEPWEEAYINEKLPNEDIVFHPGSFSASPDVRDDEAEATVTVT